MHWLVGQPVQQTFRRQKVGPRYFCRELLICCIFLKRRLRLCIPCSIFTFYTAGYLSRKGLWCVRGLGLSRTCLSASLPLGNSVLSLLLQDPPFCPLPLDNVRVCGHQRVICRRLHIHLYPHQRNRSTHVHSATVSEDSRDIMLGYIKPCSLIILQLSFYHC